MKINKSFPLSLLLSLLVLQGYIEFFLFKGNTNTIPWLQYRPLIWGLLPCIGLWLIMFFNSKTIRFRGQHLLFMAFVYLFAVLFWGLLGIVNAQAVAGQNLRSFIQILLIVMMSYTCVINPSSIKKILARFNLVILILCISHIISVLLRYVGFDMPFSFGRYIYILNFGYCCCFAQAILSKEGKAKNILCSIFFAVGMIITFQKPVMFVMSISTLILFSLILFHTRFKKQVIMKMIAIFFLSVISVTIMINAINWVGGGALSYSFKGYLAKRYLKFHINQIGGAADVDYMDIFSYSHRGDLLGGRTILWEDAWNIFKNNMLIGKGFGIHVSTRDNVDPSPLHNIIFYFLACSGLLGTILMLGIICICLRIFFKSLKSEEHIDLKVGLLAFILGVLCFNLVALFFAVYALMFLFSICFGVLLKLSCLERQNKLLMLTEIKSVP